MANPQLEDGYLKIANKIWDELCHIRISGEANQVLGFIIRKTYGFNKKSDIISLSQFSEGTGLSKPHVIRAVKHLLELNIITKKGNGLSVTYSFQKDYTKWKSLPKKVTLPKKAKSIANNGNKSLPIMVPTKDNINTKKTICRDSKKSNPDHPRFVKFWCEEYKKKFGVDYGFDGGKDAKLIKQLLSQFKNYDLLCRMALSFFETDDEFVKNKTGYTIAALKLKSNQLAPKLVDTPKNKTPEEIEIEELRKEVMANGKNNTKSDAGDNK